MESIKIPFNKTKLFLFFLGSLLFVIAGFYFLIYPPDLSDLIRFNTKMSWAKSMGSLLIGILSIIFFGITCIINLKKILLDSYSLIINEQVIINNSSGFTKKEISFSEIEKFEKVTVDKNEFIYIFISNPKKYISDHHNIIGKFFMKLNYRFYKTPIMLNKHTIEYNFDELLILFKKSVKKLQNKI